MTAALQRLPRFVQQWYCDPQDEPAEFSADGTRVTISGFGSSPTTIWDIKMGAGRRDPPPSVGAAESARMTPDGRRMVTSGPGGVVVWDIAKLQRIAGPLEAGPVATDVAITANGRRIATASDRTARSGTPPTANR